MDDSECQASRGERLRSLTLLCASSLTVMAGTPVAPALPTMAAAFEGQPHADLLVRLMLTMPALFIALIAPASGWIADRFGRKPLLVWGTVLYTFAGTSGLYLDSLPAIVAGRALLGVAVAAVMTAAVTLIGDYFTGEARRRFLGLQAAFMSFGGMIFLLAGGMLADFSWRGPFAVYLAALAVLPMVLWSIREPIRDHARRKDTHGSAPTAVVPLRTVGLIYAIAFLGMTAFYAIPVQLPFHLQTVTDANGTYVGIAIACMTLFSTLMSILYSRIKARMSFQGVIAVMLLGMAVGYLIITAASGYTMILAGMMVAGLGLGLMLPNLNLWLMSEAPEARRGRLVGGLTTAIFLGQFASPLAVQPIEAVWSTAGVFGILGVCLLVASACFAAYALLQSRARKKAAPRSAIAPSTNRDRRLPWSCRGAEAPAKRMSAAVAPHESAERFSPTPVLTYGDGKTDQG